MPWFRYRTIRSQLTIGFIILELLFTVCFSLLVLRTELREIHRRALRRIEQQVNLLATMATDALIDNESNRLVPMAQALEASTSVHFVRLTDPQGAPLLPNSGHMETSSLSAVERRQLPIPGRTMEGADVFQNEEGNNEAVHAIRYGDELLGYAWVAENPTAEKEEVDALVRITVIAGVFGALGCLLASALLARSIARPLRIVMNATRRLIRDPETKEGFPLEVAETNEAGELAQALNLLVLSMEEQRAGLSDTLSLLDSMLAHAPIGFAFLDRQGRFIRVNNFLAGSMGIELTEFLGHTASELFGATGAETLEPRMAAIFEGARPVDTFELQMTDAKGDARTWLVNLYPVKSGQQEVRWVGAVMIDTTERRRSEETLRRTEKLAAAGQLAASIAHEINNPLEAVTNLLFLLQTQTNLDEDAARFTEMAQHEVARVSEIAQQTLRFYRPSTAPALANVGEILDSILTLHSGRIHTLRVEVTRRYGKDIQLYCLSGALRQVFANLLTNALDALNGGGRLFIRAERSHSWKDGRSGVRVVVADTGSGMTEAVRRRIFEPFFTTKLATGTGLGLWVTLDIMGKHQGSIVVRSRREGERRASGTAFMLFFPDNGVGEPPPPPQEPGEHVVTAAVASEQVA
ncbi:MAG TPA: ATP-binding protein [Acidobacteriaceae bacterium]